MYPVMKAAQAAGVKAAAASPRIRGRVLKCALGLIIILVLMSTPVTSAESEPELCVFRALDPRIVSPWFSDPRHAPGCSSHGQIGFQGTEVHAIRMIIDKKTSVSKWPLFHGLPLIELILNTTPHNSTDTHLALLLSSDRPFAWKVISNGVNQHINHTLVVCRACRIITSFVAPTIIRKDLTNKKSVSRFANKTWHALTSFTEVHGGNRIELKVGYGVDGEDTGECNMNSRQQSPVASASLSLPQPSQGCLNEDSIGHNSRDVYVVEVQSQNPSGPGAVQVILQGEGPRPVPRNVTLVLKAHRPTRWQLGSKGLKDNIIVVSDQQVENSGDDVVVRSKHLEDGLDKLLLQILTEYGRPVLYAKTERASGLRLVIPSKEYGFIGQSEDSLSGDMAADDDDEEEEDELEIPIHHVIQPTSRANTRLFTPQQHGVFEGPLKELRQSMKVTCESKRMIATFSTKTIARHGIKKLTLNDPSCIQQSNTTHIWLETHITLCGSLSSNLHGRTLYSNFVHIKFNGHDDDDDDDSEKSFYKIPMTCQYKIRGNVVVPVNDTEYLPSVESNPGNEVYKMEVFRDPEHSRLLRVSENSPAEVEHDEILYFRVWMDTALKNLQVVTENCWISNSSDPHYNNVKMMLIKNTCPFDISVDVIDPLSPAAKIQHAGFSFHVIPRYWDFSKFYVHCTLGLCTLDENAVKANLLKCVNQAQHCFRGLTRFYGNMTSTVQQLIRRGPFKPVPRKTLAPVKPTRLPIPDGIFYPNGKREKITVNDSPTSAPSIPVETSPKTSSVIDGISAEIAAGIALASFFIGVCLTATLWFIQTRTDPLRNHRNKESGQLQQRATTSRPDLQQSGSAVV